MTPNAGIWVGIAALEWTKQYISGFGVDPERVTAIGESPGGGIVQHIVTMHVGQCQPPPFNQVSIVNMCQALVTDPGNPEVPRLKTPYQRFMSND
jgi:acetyl esterase/lipase